jgi:hypothetical protein
MQTYVVAKNIKKHKNLSLDNCCSMLCSYRLPANMELFMAIVLLEIPIIVHDSFVFA